jgi:hypothetical protein
VTHFRCLPIYKSIKTYGFLGCHIPEALTRFNTVVERQRADRPHWGDWLPARGPILNHPDLNANTALLVDLGAVRGHDQIGFRERCPGSRDRLIKEDLSAVIEEVHGLERTQQC